MPADADPEEFQSVRREQSISRSDVLSMANTVKDTAKSRKVAILAADGVEESAIHAMQEALVAAGAVPKVVAPHGGMLEGAAGGRVAVDFSLLTVGSVLFDAVFIPGGASSTRALARDASAVLFVREAYKHCKALAASGTGRAVAEAAAIDMQDVLTSQNGVTPKMTEDFLQAVAQHREWTREAKAESVPA